MGTGNRGDGVAYHVRSIITRVQFRNHSQLKSLAKTCSVGLCVQRQALCNPNVLFADLLEVYHLKLISELLSVKKIILKAYELTLSHTKFKMSKQVVGFADYQIKTIS